MSNVVGLFDHYDQADKAVQALQNFGVDNHHISVLTQEELKLEHEPDHVTSGAEAGAATGGLIGLLAGLSALVIPGIGPVIATGTIAGTLAAALGMTAVGAGVGAAAGGLLGALVDLGFSREDAELYAEGLKRGGLLVSVDTNTEYEETVREILKAAGAVDMNTRRQTWVDQGWKGWDEYEDIPQSDEAMSSRKRSVY